MPSFQTDSKNSIQRTKELPGRPQGEGNKEIRETNKIKEVWRDAWARPFRNQKRKGVAVVRYTSVKQPGLGRGSLFHSEWDHFLEMARENDFFRITASVRGVESSKFSFCFRSKDVLHSSSLVV